MTSRFPAVRSQNRPVLKWSLFAAMLASALTVDLVTKHLAVERLPLGEVREVLPFLSLQRTANDGAAFGLFGGKSAWIIALNVIALIVVLLYVLFERRPLLGGIAGGSVVGGSLGNMIGRLSGDGQVTDFLKFPHWPNFNAADVFIDAGLAAVVIGLVVEMIIAWRANRKSPKSS